MSLEYKFPFMDERVEESGLRLIILPDRSQPVVTLSLQINAGAFDINPTLSGVSELLSLLIQKGCGGKSAEEFAHEIESKGAEVSVVAKERSLSIKLEVMKKYFAEIVPYIFCMVSEPNLEKSEFNKVKKELLTGLKTEISNPAYLASVHFNAELFGPDNPAGRTKSKQSLKSITLADLEDYFNTYYSPENSSIVVAGDIDIEEARNLLLMCFGRWEKSSLKKENPIKIIPPKIDQTIIRLIDKPELTQTTLHIGFESLGELHRDRLKLSIANYILGGGNFSSRLMKKIRSELGNTYGISSRVWSDKDQGAFRITTSTKNDTLSEVINAIVDVLKEFSKNGVTAEELEQAKGYLSGSMAFQFEGINSLVSRLQWLRFYGRDNSFFETFQKRLSEISLDSLNEVIKQNFRAENLVIAAVGKRDEVESLLSKFGKIKNYNFRKPIN